MTFKRWMQAAVICTSMLALAACTTKHRATDQAAINTANSAYGGARVSGLGDDARFGGAGREYAASKRVYYFDFDKSNIRESDKAAIIANSEHLAASPKKVMVEGHTDPRGSREYNIGLGERRAQAVANLMKEKGVNSSHIRVVSYGAQKLASSEHNEEAYQQDRRAVLVNEQR